MTDHSGNETVQTAAGISPAWLTSALRESGVLATGMAEAVEVERSDAFNSVVTRLRVRYSHDTPAKLPTTMILKRNLPAEWAVQAGSNEVAMYRLFMKQVPALPMIADCYAAYHDAEHKNSYLLLQDLTATHRVPVTRAQQLMSGQNVPLDDDLDRIVGTLAHFHAHWWQHHMLEPTSQQNGIWYLDRAQFEDHLIRCRKAWSDLCAEESGWFPRELHHLYERVLSAALPWWLRSVEPRMTAVKHVTLTHGDAYCANFLCPADALSDAPTYLIDWQSASAHVGTQDLVNLCATFWTSKQRHERNREQRVLSRYLDVLHTCGVTEYGFDDLLEDYRIALIDWVLVPLQDRYGGSAREYWWPKMQCLTAAFQDFHCAELLET